MIDIADIIGCPPHVNESRVMKNDCATVSGTSGRVVMYGHTSSWTNAGHFVCVAMSC
jgi:hypothetical protein